MKSKGIPDGYHTLSPYLTVKDARALTDFLKKAFDAETEIQTMPDGTVFNANAKVGDSMVMMGQVPKDYPDEKLSKANLYMYVEDVDAVYKKAIQAGGESIHEPADQVYGDRRAGIIDPAGNQWWIATRIEDLSSEELSKRAAERNKQQ